MYLQTYRAHLGRSIEGLSDADADAAAARLHLLHDLIASSVVGPEGESSTHTTLSSEAGFRDSVDGATGLIAHLAARRERVRQALAE